MFLEKRTHHQQESSSRIGKDMIICSLSQSRTTQAIPPRIISPTDQKVCIIIPTNIRFLGPTSSIPAIDDHRIATHCLNVSKSTKYISSSFQFTCTSSTPFPAATPLPLLPQTERGVGERDRETETEHKSSKNKRTFCFEKKKAFNGLEKLFWGYFVYKLSRECNFTWSPAIDF